MSKAKNALLTLACGDAYGNAYEMDGLIGTKFDKAALPNEAKIKNYTDDTKMAMILWDHYNTYGTIDESRLFEAYAKWAEEDGYADGIGIHTAAVLLRQEKDKSSQGNGALMRVLPFGLRLIEEGMPFEKAVEMVNIDAALTHDNDVVRMTNQLCLDIAVNGLDVLNKDVYRNIRSQLKSGHTAWVIYTVNDVLDVLKMDLNILDGFKELVSRGGDTDTNCATYGAMRGYRDTLEVVLDKYLDRASQTILQTL
jgi:ADP-ribosylglycohydrolase